MSELFQPGDLVRVVRLPSTLKGGDLAAETSALFEMCVGRVFAISELHRGLVGLDVGEVVGRAAYLETIYIEPSCVERVGGAEGL